MTLQEVEWAKAHDWYTSYSEVATKSYRVYTSEGVSFHSFPEMVKWAGY